MRSSRIAAAVLLVVALGGVAPPVAAAAPIPVPAGWTARTVHVTAGGLSRGYLIVRPAARSGTALPVLVELHGCCTSAAAEAKRSNFLAVTGPAILVYPSGYGCSYGCQAVSSRLFDVISW
jgi:poly(3-hydroxybutyrate) depolymerase